MYRRLISSSVLAAFVVAQGVAMPHTHAEGNPLDHGAAPHVHFGEAQGSSHPHAHAHAWGHVHRHAAPTLASHSASNECNLSSLANHDDNAVYLPPSVTLASAGGSDQFNLLTSPALLHSIDAAALDVVDAAYQAALLRLPGERAPGCDFCLTLRALRI